MKKFADGAIIPTAQTIFSWQNLLLVAIFLVSIPIINVLMTPKNKDEIIEVDPALFGDEKEEEPKPKADMTPAERIENSCILSMIIGAIGVVYIVTFFSKGGGLGLNIVNFIFLTLGIILHKTPIRYVNAINDAIKNCGGIALQFPFYAGIMGMMISSGLAVTFSEVFVNISNSTTFPFFTYLSAGIVNFFVPSGGGQWAVQGPIMMPAAKAIGVPYSTTAWRLPGVMPGPIWFSLSGPCLCLLSLSSIFATSWDTPQWFFCSPVL